MITVPQIRAQLEQRLSNSRYQHTLRVVETALPLAERLGVCRRKTRIAALLHDCAKGLDHRHLTDLARDSDWKIPEIEYQSPQLLHAPAGARLAKEEFGVIDKEILEAIRYHTIGHPDMGNLSRIIFMADFIEPGRDFSGVHLIRETVNRDFDRAIIEICDSTIAYNIDKGRLIHPYTLELRNALLRGVPECAGKPKK